MPDHYERYDVEEAFAEIRAAAEMCNPDLRVIAERVDDRERGTEWGKYGGYVFVKDEDYRDVIPRRITDDSLNAFYAKMMGAIVELSNAQSQA